MVDQPNPTVPPGFENFSTVLGWICWGAIIVCFIGIVISGARLAIAYRNNEMEGAKSLVLALVGCVIVVGSASIVNAVV